MKTENAGKSTREIIFETAVNLFSENGYHGTSMRDIARRVGIKESSIYNHYSGKKAILEAVLEYQISGLKAAMFTREEMEETSQRFSDPVELWLFGTMEYLKRLPPLTEEINMILMNEMYLDQECRKFVLESMFSTQKEMTEILLQDLCDKGMIAECDVRTTAAQYVYMLHGLNMENRLLRLEGADGDAVSKNLSSQISLFISRLQN